MVTPHFLSIDSQPKAVTPAILDVTTAVKGSLLRSFELVVSDAVMCTKIVGVYVRIARYVTVDVRDLTSVHREASHFVDDCINA